jgi:excisionase family DNA binding protein
MSKPNCATLTDAELNENRKTCLLSIGMEPSTHTILTSEQPALFTSADACQFLRISKSTLYRLIANGDLTPAHIGRSVRFTRVELQRFVAELGD